MLIKKKKNVFKCQKCQWGAEIENEPSVCKH